MFRITQNPSSGCDNLYLTEITYNGSNVLIMCVVGVWRHVLDLLCVCVCVCVCVHCVGLITTAVVLSNNDARWKPEVNRCVTVKFFRYSLEISLGKLLLQIIKNAPSIAQIVGKMLMNLNKLLFGNNLLRWIFRKRQGVVGTGWSWLRLGRGGGHL